jgi:thiol-disulfide isomerase/thioredoxin
MKFALRFFLLSVVAFFSLGSTVTAKDLTEPTDIYVVMFRSDTCPPCKIVEPLLQEALASIRDPKIEYLKLNFFAGNGEWNTNAVFDRGIVDQYNQWAGITGFAVIIDADKKNTLGCVGMTYTADSMERHIRVLQKKAQKNETNFDFTCPEPARALPQGL